MTRVLSELKRRKDRNKLYDYKPYARQRMFHNASGQFRERLFMAGNQLGKTWSSAYEIAIHLTGMYPDWWEGSRWMSPVTGWAMGVTNESLRDTLQRLLLGRPGDWGTGTIPADLIIDIKRAQGIADAVDTILVRHISGGTSRVSFKSYEKGRAKLQGETINFAALDEEPPMDIYVEVLTRTNAVKGGMVWLTFTPLMGMSDVVKRFLNEQNPDRNVTTMTIEDVEHYTREEKDRIIASYPAHERKARAQGIPFLGSGQVFPVPEDNLMIEYMVLPDHWPRICGIDFGFDHPFAAVWLAWDRDTDTIYIYDVFKNRQGTPRTHAPVISSRGPWVPVAWPHDGLQHSKDSGIQLAEQYRAAGLNMLHERAQYEETPDGGQNSRFSVEAGIMDMLERMNTGRFKVFSHLADWWEEFRMYHRKDGKIVAKDDDAMSATRYAVMSLRFSALPPVHQRRKGIERDYDWRVG